MTRDMATLIATVIPVVVIPLVLELRYQGALAREVIAHRRRRRKDGALPLIDRSTVIGLSGFSGLLVIVLAREELVALIAASVNSRGGHKIDVVISVIAIVIALSYAVMLPVVTELLRAYRPKNYASRK